MVTKLRVLRPKLEIEVHLDPKRFDAESWSKRIERILRENIYSNEVVSIQVRDTTIANH